MEEVETQYTVEQVKELLSQQEVPGDDARILIAIAYLESKFKHGIDGDTDIDDKGLWQINPPRYFTGEKPDNMTVEFFENQGKTLSLEDFTKSVKYDIKYATAFAAHIVDYRRRNPKSYGPDPFDAWKTYTKYIKPNMSRLGADNELVLIDGLDAEITKAVDYIKNYNQISFGNIDDVPVTTTVPPTTTTVPPTTTTTIPEDTEIDTTSRSAGITNQFGKPPRERDFEQSDFYKLLNPMFDSPTEPDRPLRSDMSLVDKGNEAFSNIPVGPITQKIRDGNTPIQMLIDRMVSSINEKRTQKNLEPIQQQQPNTRKTMSKEIEEAIRLLGG